MENPMVETSNIHFPRLGTCEQCLKNQAKYSCPRCGTKTCCLDCVNKHKQISDCNGIRDKTAYKPVSQFTELDLLSDYRLMEEVGRSVDTLSNDQNKRHTRFKRDLPLSLYRLRSAAAKRGIQLKFQPQNFTRNKDNTTFLNWQTQKIEWRIEWRISGLKDKIIDKRVPEESILGEVLEKHLETEPNFKISDENGASPHVFLAAEHVPGESGRFYALDLSASLSDNFKSKIIIEFPILRVECDSSKLTRYQLVGTGPPVVAAKRNTGKVGGNEDEDLTSNKKSKLTFYEVSDGELTDSD